MSKSIGQKILNKAALDSDEKIVFSNKSVFVREDDQDWGSAGMNDIQKDPDISS